MLYSKAFAERSGLKFEGEVKIPRPFLEVERLFDVATFVGEERECKQVQQLVSSLRKNLLLLNMHIAQE